ncbi:hypothetical protein RO3G_04129 [Rhizopus delemar RA 99-880]|uniref:Uncharacterized protein n=1 Tax=Rhizopus delemar (strain RA 99-880 / ATCC MYA-4621 / FGSC 9543 / NRRL 43880) TaxID=246409 RepID=I1BT94_RHIO9|nr:hypothetical protein RO3G_04129 [Rhizopus delemar RA 99-880]|eukprot:EIE79424.1 hypothetical protein RO3G_04129 [Rhizopus delemar RA 99-880]
MYILDCLSDGICHKSRRHMAEIGKDPDIQKVKTKIKKQYYLLFWEFLTDLNNVILRVISIM